MGYFRKLSTARRRPRRKWVDNIKIYLREIGWDGMDWLDLAQDRNQWRALVWLNNWRLLKKGSVSK
jgi:hypothetical protein